VRGVPPLSLLVLVVRRVVRGMSGTER